MSMKSLLLAGVGACALGLVGTAAQAAPAAGLAGAVDADAARSGLVENVTWYGRRHCHWDGHCWHGHRYYRPYYGDYGYGRRYYRPYYGYDHDYRYGHRRWWH